MKKDFFNDNLENKAVILHPEEGEAFHMNGVTLTFKVTSEISNDQLGVYDIVLAPGVIGAKLHYHRFMDETFIVTQGVITMQTQDGEVEAKAGTVVYIPRFTPHGFSNNSTEEAKLILLFNPAQSREDFFRGLKETLTEQPIDPAKYLKLYNKYDSFPVDTDNMLPLR
jgi:quercetin dioxygenase-like cupin family protein